jgi:hypothetical protein
LSQNKGQITLFIIIAIAILAIVGLIIYFTNIASTKQFKPSDILVQAQFEPVQDYITQCINQIATDGVVKIGLHGGYIDPIDPVLSGVYFESNPLQQYNSDLAFLTSNDKNSGVAYWFETKSTSDCDNCIVSTLTPSIYSMQQQLNQYVAQNMRSCLNNYNTLKEQGYIIEDNYNYSVETAITQNGVAILVGGNVNITITNQHGNLEIFYTELDIPLLKYYNIATNITLKQMQNNFLENVGIYLINAHSGLNSTLLPPIHDSSNGYNIILWSKAGSKQKFQTLLTSYIPVLRVINSKNDLEVKDASLSPTEYYFYNATRLDIPVTEDLSTTEISFSYLGQDVYFDILPSEGELLGAQTNDPKGFSALFQERIFNNYNFYYQTSYPVIVEIKDEYKKDSYYTFMFALEGTIIDNYRIKDYLNYSSGPIYWDPSFVSINYNYPDSDSSNMDLSSLGLDSRISQNYPNSNFNTNNYNVPSLIHSNSRFCDINQRVSGLVTLKTYDSITGNALEDVTVKFGCGNFMECNVGRTIYDLMLQESIIQTKLPTCNNGYVSLSKQGYLTKNLLLSTDSKDSRNLGSIYLDPIITKKFNINKYFVEKHLVMGTNGEIQYSSYALTPSINSLSENDTVVITFEKVLYDITDEPYGQTVLVSIDSENISREIMLVSGAYKVNMQLLDDAGIIIPKECKTICVDKTIINSVFGGCNEEEKIPEDSIVIKPAPWGGVIFDNQTLVYISAEELSQDNVLEFNVMRLPEPRCFDDMSDMSQIRYISETYSDILLPKFIFTSIVE